MKNITLAIAALLLFGLIIPSVAYAVPTDYVTVRQALTAPDDPDFSVFDPEILPGILIQIIENDPADANYHNRVINSALAVLGGLEQSVEIEEVLIDQLPDFPATCIYWLGFYASENSLEALRAYLWVEDASLRYEAATSLASLPDLDTEDIGALEVTLNAVKSDLEQRLQSEDDADVVEALVMAVNRINEILFPELATN